jgi:transposase InsO family protein
MITFKGQRYDWNFYVDVFDGAIVGSCVTPYYSGMNLNNHVLALKEMLIEKEKRGYKAQETIFHSDQGAIYTSASFNDVHKDYNIIRSMSRAGTPTDNPIIESKNGWLKAEIVVDFNENDFECVEEFIKHIIYDNNYLRPSYKLKYKTPIQYRTELGFT